MSKIDNERLVGDEIPLMMEREAGAPEALVSAILVGFGMMQEYHEGESRKAGHPVYVDRVFYSAKIPGDRNTHSIRHANDKDFEMFPKAYAAFQNRSITPIVGMPIEQWPQITRAQALLLKRQDIHTVETLAAVHDGHIGNLGQNGRQLRAKAQAFLEQARDTAAAQRLAAENEAQKQEMAELRRQIADLASRLADDPKRRRKEEAAA